MIDRLAPRVQQFVDDALDHAAAQGRADLIADLAFPLPFQVISEMLGMPDSDRDQMRGWAHTLTLGLEAAARAATPRRRSSTRRIT